MFRYEISTGSTDWADAERQIRSSAKDGGAKSMTVSVKSGNKDKKRKAGDAVEEAQKEAERFQEGGKKKKSKSGKSSK